MSLSLHASEKAAQLLEQAIIALQQADPVTARKHMRNARSFGVRLRNLEYINAVTFYRVKDRISAILALKEELRYFPDNRDAELLLKDLSDEPITAAERLPELRVYLERLEIEREFSDRELEVIVEQAFSVVDLGVQGNFVAVDETSIELPIVLAWVASQDQKQKRFVYSCSFNEVKIKECAKRSLLEKIILPVFGLEPSALSGRGAAALVVAPRQGIDLVESFKAICVEGGKLFPFNLVVNKEFAENSELDYVRRERFRASNAQPIHFDRNELFQLFYLTQELWQDKSTLRYIMVTPGDAEIVRLLAEGARFLRASALGVVVTEKEEAAISEVSWKFDSSLAYLRGYPLYIAKQLLEKVFVDRHWAQFCLIDCHKGRGEVEALVRYYAPLLAEGGIIALHNYLPEITNQNFMAIYGRSADTAMSVRNAVTNLIASGKWELVSVPVLYPGKPCLADASLPLVPGMDSSLVFLRKKFDDHSVQNG